MQLIFHSSVLKGVRMNAKKMYRAENFSSHATIMTEPAPNTRFTMSHLMKGILKYLFNGRTANNLILF